MGVEVIYLRQLARIPEAAVRRCSTKWMLLYRKPPLLKSLFKSQVFRAFKFNNTEHLRVTPFELVTVLLSKPPSF